MINAARLFCLSGLGMAVAVMALPAHARTEVAPYIELDQTFIANLKGGSDDVLTYTSAAVGVDATMETARSEGQLSLRYEHQFGWNRASADSDILSGLARARYSVTPGTLSIEGGALATHVRTDGFSSANGSLAVAGDAKTNVYSLYAGPTLSTQVNEIDVEASYRIGYTRVEDDVSLSVPGQIELGRFDESVYHSATASVGQQPGGYLPIGWAIGAGYDREDATELDQRYVSKWVRGDVTIPITYSLAFVGGIGYEDIRISQRAVLLDGNGNPVVGSNGRLVTDPASPRQIAYDIDGLIWDAGVLWRPSRRTSLEVRVGERYDSTHYVGNFSWRASPNGMLQIAYFDTIDSFGRAMNNSLIALPSSGFVVRRNPFSSDITGCVGGQDGGSCFNDALAAISASNYRHRGIEGQYSWARGRWNWGAGFGWSQRKFIAPDNSVLASINGEKDYYYFGELFGGVKLSEVSNLGATLYGSHLDAGLSSVDVTNYGTYVSYSRLFGRRLSAQASLGLDALDTSDLETIISLLGQVGVRYQF